MLVTLRGLDMTMMTLFFPSIETKMTFTHTDGVYHHWAQWAFALQWMVRWKTWLYCTGSVARTSWCRLSLFSHEVIVTSNVNGSVIDSNWHKVEVAFQNRVRIFFGKKFPIWIPFYLCICTWMWITFYFIKNLLYNVSLLFSKPFNSQDLSVNSPL